MKAFIYKKAVPTVKVNELCGVIEVVNDEVNRTLMLKCNDGSSYIIDISKHKVSIFAN